MDSPRPDGSGPGPGVPDSPRPDGLKVKNTFLDCPSPWHLDVGELPKKSNSDPGSSSQATSSAASSEIATSGSEAEGPTRVERMRRMIEAQGASTKRPGDEGHAEGTCRPCKYWVKKAGCQAGADCDFCHFLHDAGHPGTKWRPCRAKRKRYNRLLERLEVQVEAGGGNFDLNTVELPPSIEGNAFLKDKVKRKLQQTLVQGGSQAGSSHGDSQAGSSHGGSQTGILAGEHAGGRLAKGQAGPQAGSLAKGQPGSFARGQAGLRLADAQAASYALLGLQHPGTQAWGQAGSNAGAQGAAQASSYSQPSSWRGGNYDPPAGPVGDDVVLDPLAPLEFGQVYRL